MVEGTHILGEVTGSFLYYEFVVLVYVHNTWYTSCEDCDTNSGHQAQPTIGK